MKIGLLRQKIRLFCFFIFIISNMSLIQVKSDSNELERITLTIYPIADTYIENRYSNDNFGDEILLSIWYLEGYNIGSNVIELTRKILIAFEIEDLPQTNFTIEKAYVSFSLYFQVYEVPVNIFEVPPFQENTTTWENYPPFPDKAITTAAYNRTNPFFLSSIHWNVTSVVNTNRKIYFGLSTNIEESTNIDESVLVYSKEQGGERLLPRLTITYTAPIKIETSETPLLIKLLGLILGILLILILLLILFFVIGRINVKDPFYQPKEESPKRSETEIFDLKWITKDENDVEIRSRQTPVSSPIFYLKDEPKTCVICRQKIMSDEEATSCPSCNSRFHLRHFAEWVRQKGTCPHCNERIGSK